jgi:putative addiction module component (TIGR02574 family)
MEKPMSTYEEIISAALSLPPGARAMLAEHLLDSLNGEDQKRIDALWADEIERRIREVDEGKVTPIPGDQVMDRLRTRRSRK